MNEKELIVTDHDRLIKIETLLETTMLQHEVRISRLENGLSKFLITFVITVVGAITAWFFSKR